MCFFHQLSNNKFDKLWDTAKYCYGIEIFLKNNMAVIWFIVFVHLEGHPLWSVTNRTVAKGLFFCYPRWLYCPDEMLAVMVLSQHQVLSFKIVRPHAPCDA